MTMAISKAVERGAKAVICASTGNTSASAAAYAARAGLICAVVIPEGQIALGKLAQALIHGARVRAGARQLRRARSRSCASSGSSPGVEVVNSINPVRIEGQKTAAFEIVDVLGDAPTRTASRSATPATSPRTGGATPSTPRARARRLARPACSGGRPRARRRSCAASRCSHPETIATAIQIGNPASWERRDRRAATSRAATSARSPTPRSSRPTGCSRPSEGVFVEPASAASVAGLLKAAADGLLAADDGSCAPLTGHGLKDPQRAIAEVQVGDAVDATAATVAVALDWRDRA